MFLRFGPYAINYYTCSDPLLQGVTYPAALSLLGKWSPPSERSIMATLTFTGKYANVIVITGPETF